MHVNMPANMPNKQPSHLFFARLGAFLDAGLDLWVREDFVVENGAVAVRLAVLQPGPFFFFLPFEPLADRTKTDEK